MFQQQVFIINTVLMALDALCVVFAGYGALRAVDAYSYGLVVTSQNSFNISVLLTIFLNNHLLDRFGLYHEKRQGRYGSLLWAVAKTAVLDFVVLSAVFFVLTEEECSRLFIMALCLLTFLFLCAERILAEIYIDVVSRKGFNARRVLVVGDVSRAALVMEVLRKQLSWGHQVIGVLPLEEEGKSEDDGLDRFRGMLQETEVDEVVFAAGAVKPLDFAAYLDICGKVGIATRILPALWNPETRRLGVEQSQGIPFLTLHANGLNASGLMYKRMLDLMGGLVGTLVFLILYPFVALAIKLDSTGPVLFRQERIGKNGRHFTLLKFRSMHVDAEERKKALIHRNEMKGPVFKCRNDPRVTRVGRLLRKTSLDEFPQFVNVLRGEMSLVGTRPPTVEEVEQYDLCHRKRLSIKPGITGLWQVTGRNRIDDFEEIVKLDCQYLENWRFMDDVRILLRTVGVVLMRKGAY